MSTSSQSEDIGLSTPSWIASEGHFTVARAVPSSSCWTCRIRKKKCDEVKDPITNSCETCIRLKLVCLGWGAQRPLWMKDKNAIKAVRSSIKAATNDSKNHTRIHSSGESPSVAGSFYSSGQGEAVPRLEVLTADTSKVYPYRRRAAHPQDSQTTIPYSQIGPYIERYIEHLQVAWNYPYFHRVWATIKMILVNDLGSAFACAWAAKSAIHAHYLKNGRILVWNPTSPSLALRFFEQTVASLQSRRGQWSQPDILTILMLMSFGAFSGEQHEWGLALAMGLEWMFQVGFLESGDPCRVYDGLSMLMQVAVRHIMWIDVCASVTLVQPPGGLAIYKQICPSSGVDTFGVDWEIQLNIGLISSLAHWKSENPQRAAELRRRGAEIYTKISSGSPPALVQPLSRLEWDSQAYYEINSTASLLYLYSVLNPLLDAPEVVSTVAEIGELLTQLPVKLTNALVFPVAIAGAMSISPAARELFDAFLLSPATDAGNTGHIRSWVYASWRIWDRGDKWGIKAISAEFGNGPVTLLHL